jgi:Tfp pilus assembly protein PilO
MTLKIKPRERRALLLLVLALAVYEFANALVLPAYDRIAAGHDLAVEKESQLKKYRRTQLRKGQYEALLKTAAARVTQGESVLLSGTNPAAASAELQSLVEGAASKIGVVVGQRAMGSPKRLNDFYSELSMTLSFDSTPGQVVSFLSELRSLPRFVAVRSLQISPIEPVLEAPKGMSISKNVRVSMTVYSLAAADIAKPQSGTK